MTSSLHLARERRVAKRVLPHFGLGQPSVRLIKTSTTTLFRVRDVHQRQFVLRIQHGQQMPLHAVQAELAWLTLLRAQTSLRVPEPVRTSTGAWVVSTHADTPEDVRLCALFHWIPGRHKRRLTTQDAALLGTTLGTLHHFASTYPPATTLARWQFDSTSFAENATVLDRSTNVALTSRDRTVLGHAIAYVQSHLTTLDTQPDSIGLIHADPNLTNWLFHQDWVALLDFEVCCFGYYVFDIGRVLHEFEQHGVQGTDLVGAFQRGYMAARPTTRWNDEQVVAGKLMSLVDVVLWALTLEPRVLSAWGEHRIHETMKQIDTTLAQIKEHTVT